jgi:protein ImuB
MFAGIHGQNLSDGLSLAEFAYSFSPFVEEVWPDTVVIDVEGCALLFGSAYELATVIAKQAGAPKQSGGLAARVNVALAANPDTAVHAARRCRGITFIALGEELACLGQLPISALEYSLVSIEDKRAQEIFETLKLWGVLTFKEFAELPVAGISERLGQDGVKLQQLAGGKTDRHLKLKQATPVFENSIELEYPIAQLEPLSFIFARLLNQICASLRDYALATNELYVQLKLENKSAHELKLNLPYPMRDHKVFLKLLLLDAEAHPPSAAVVAVSINCEPVKPRVLQSGLFMPLVPEPAKLELTLARLAKLVGIENVGSPELLDTHRPDAFRVKRFVIKEQKQKRSRQRSVNSKQQTANSNATFEIPTTKFVMGFRRFRPPLRAMVEAAHGYPTEINAWGKDRSVYGKVVGLAGPWRTSGEWWRSDLWARDEWDVAVESRGQRSEGSKIKEVNSQAGPSQILYRIYRELRSGTWFVEGVYD